MKKIGALFLLVFILAGCGFSDPKSASNTLTQKEQLCQELKRNIIFSTTSGPTFGAASTTQKAEMYRLYEKYDCNNLRKN